MVGAVCPVCHGKRLKREALAVTFAGLDIGALARMPLSRARRGAAAGRGGPLRADRPDDRARKREPGDARPRRGAARDDTARRVAAGGSAHAGAPDVRRDAEPLGRKAASPPQRIAADLVARIGTLESLGLGYLSLDRSTPTLSPGELQRLRLATQIRSNLFGVVYVLDEPTAGLHPADGDALLAALDGLKRSGNSIFVVEHDLGDDAPRRLDRRRRPRRRRARRPRPLQRAAGRAWRDVRRRTRRAICSRATEPRAARAARAAGLAASCDGIDAQQPARRSTSRFPLGVLTAVTGVSGSGKSSLVSQALVELVCRHLGHEPASDDDEPSDRRRAHRRPKRRAATSSAAWTAIQRLVRVDQKPIGRTPRSNLATYTGLFDGVRKLFAATPAARARRYDAGRFSFNVAKGRCETCEGEGFVSVELLFMPSVYAPCPTCHGARYNAEDARGDVARARPSPTCSGMTVDDACALLRRRGRRCCGRSPLLRDIGLGYLRLGQPATELSGGEAQRIKLATELQKQQRGRSLYVLDEPTTGLHPADVDKLMVAAQGPGRRRQHGRRRRARQARRRGRATG